MRIHFPNSAHLRNLQGFIRQCDFNDPSSLVLSLHPKWVSVHPVALAMAASAGLAVRERGGEVRLDIPNPRMDSIRYLPRMKLFETLGCVAPATIREHEAAGRFIPITQIRTPEELSNFLVDMVPLLHADRSEVEPIQYVISELVRNVLEHAQSPSGAVLCAQYYSASRRLALGVADGGIGIRASLEGHFSVSSDIQAIMLALRPGVTGTTTAPYGTDYNARAGPFFTKSIACASNNFFVLYSGSGVFKLLGTPKAQSGPIIIRGDPNKDYHLELGDLPPWSGTVAGIDVSVQAGTTFAQLLAAIRQVYRIDKRAPKGLQEAAVRVADHTGSFAEDKDVARMLRIERVEPALDRGAMVTVDFGEVSLTTQSFIHALLSESIRARGAGILDRIRFRNCAPSVRSLIELVSEYTQEAGPAVGEGKLETRKNQVERKRPKQATKRRR